MENSHNPEEFMQASSDTLTQDWKSLLADGLIEDALLSYKVQDALDRDTLSSLETLTALRSALREKLWSKALKIVDREDNPVPIVNWRRLKEDLELLKTNAENLDKRKIEEALDSLKQMNNPVLESEIHTLRGTALIFLNETNDAKLAFERAVELDPRHFRAITNLGNLALEANQIDDAISAYEKALRLNEGFSNAQHNLGVAYRKKGQVSKSVRYLRKAQSSSQRQQREEARANINTNNPQVIRALKWLGYGVLALIVFFILRSQGIF